jgi:hypothetical protein
MNDLIIPETKEVTAQENLKRSELMAEAAKKIVTEIAVNISGKKYPPV